MYDLSRNMAALMTKKKVCQVIDIPSNYLMNKILINLGPRLKVQ